MDVWAPHSKSGCHPMEDFFARYHCQVPFSPKDLWEGYPTWKLAWYPEKWWLEDYFPFELVPFQVTFVQFFWGVWFSSQNKHSNVALIFCVFFGTSRFPCSKKTHDFVCLKKVKLAIRPKDCKAELWTYLAKGPLNESLHFIFILNM